uniref:Putative oxidoreductase yajO n=1 Tax=Aegilops tauschii TaxID=37682 RepID=N1QWA7_AEGTA
MPTRPRPATWAHEPGRMPPLVPVRIRTGTNGLARYYGGTVSESVLGDCLRFSGVPRDSFVGATKCGRYKEGFDFSATRVTRSIDESLARLGLDYVDILHCHDIEFTSLDQIVNETIPALQKIKESGKARFIGITGLPLSIFTYVLDRVPPGSVDLVLSYCHYGINDTALVDLLPYLKSKGVGVISASPLAMGLLTDNGPPEWHPAPEELKIMELEGRRIAGEVAPSPWRHRQETSRTPYSDLICY